MTRRATIYAVAELAGVSVATVSRVMRGFPGVSEATRERVQRAVQELDYVPSGAAQGLASRRSCVLGLIFPDLDDPSGDEGHETLLYSDEVIRGAERAARRSGRAILIAATHRNSDPSLALSIASKADGLVVLSRSLPDKELRAIARSMPVVVLAGRRTARQADVVKADNEGGAYALTKHLTDHHRYRSLVFLAGPAESPDGRERLAGFRTALADAGIEAKASNVIHGDFTEASGYRCVMDLLRRGGTLPEAIVGGNDQMAIGALSALDSLGIVVPRDIAVTGFDDVRLCRYVQPPLSTVSQPMRELGALCIQLLVERLENDRSTPCTSVLPTRVVLRESCGCGEASKVHPRAEESRRLQILKGEGR